MKALTIAWVAFPFLAGFAIFLYAKLARWLGILVASASAIYAVLIFLQPDAIALQFLDSFGVTLKIDFLSAYFIFTNAIVTLAVLLYCWSSNKSYFFYAQLIMLHGSVNSTLICVDFISLYVALEVCGIAAFLLIIYPRSDRAIWIGLRYLFVSNTAMLFYLMGAMLVYRANGSFAFQGLANAPPEAVALIFLGLLIKGGIFISGLWLPLTHSESETPVSAMFSGVVVKAGVYPLARCALEVAEVEPIVRFFGVATALFGISFALLARDTKRMLAFSTISQLGFILAAPAVGGFYALTHGLVKSALFMLAGRLPSRSFQELRKTGISTPLWIALTIASFSISGFPMLAGFGAKYLTSKNFLPWQVWAMNFAALGTATYFAKFIFLPKHKPTADDAPLETGFWAAMVLLLGSLIAANVIYYEAYTWQNAIKPLATIAAGWLAYFLIFKRATLKMPRWFEGFEHLIGTMGLMAMFIFWIVLVREML